ncbi:LOW QUALITY PROTEIN: presequence protease, mitochondrial-like [Atheta coriaria]|uniref:LOW QUALITY PROTEIN: presequence protease, mitochondrial-like n=1 Tax=Dalotia coriaria TaxID=877792 RepID=UPI0031F38FB1
MLRRLALCKNYLKFYKQSSCHSSQLVRKQLISEEQTDIQNFHVGTSLHGFTVKDVQKIDEFNLTAINLIHDKTQAQYLHFYRNDSNNVFSINFRTTPMNSSGLPHILEHTVLCGSKLYPVRDPFFKMLNRSLATFMNAMTASDFTMYPFSTQNLSDYRNLQRIYLDAVFRPNLKETDFMQEGWRLENSTLTDIKSDLVIKGVVYNEMKGVFSENESILQQKLQNSVLPDHTYGVCSGGDPLNIPDLTWDALKKFHQDHYHPSNSRFYSYGNFPLSPSLEYINSEYLANVERQNTQHTEVPPHTRWDAPRSIQIKGRFDKMGEPFETQNSIVISYKMSDIKNIYETFVIQFVSELLMKGPNSPFYKSMIEPNISGGFTPSTGFDAQIRDSVFSLGLQGVKVEDFGKIEKIFNDTIDKVIETGFDEKHIESVLHTYELSLKHESSNFGLTLLYCTAPIWNHNGDAIEQLRFNKYIDRLRQEIKDPKYLSNLVKQYFKENTHRLVLTMTPDKEYETKQQQLEKELLLRKTAALTDEDKQLIHKKALELDQEQKQLQDTNILPSLDMNDINTDIPKVTSEKLKDKTKTMLYKVNANGLTYFKGILNTSQLSPEQQMMLPLFCYIITKLGTDKLNYREFDSLAQRKTSGLGFRVHIGDSLYQLHSYEPGVMLSSYCLNKNLEYMWDLWSQVFNISALKDVSRFEMLVKLYMANLTHGIADSGHMYAMLAAQGLISGVAYQKDLLTGLQHISYMKRLVKTSSYAPILAELTNIGKVLFDKNNLRCSLNIDESQRDATVSSMEKFMSMIPTGSSPCDAGQKYTTTKVWAPTDSINCHHHVLNVPVNYCSKTILTVPYTHADYSRLQILAKLISAKYLHPELREKNGAYGGGLRLSTDGVLTFFSYRDPRNTATLDVFDNTHQWLSNNFPKFTPQDITEAKLGVFQSVDAPVPPGSKGSNEFFYGLTNDILQRHRAALMTVNEINLKETMEKYMLCMEPTKVGKVVLGPKPMDTAGRKDELWTVVDNE